MFQMSIQNQQAITQKSLQQQQAIALQQLLQAMAAVMEKESKHCNQTIKEIKDILLSLAGTFGRNICKRRKYSSDLEDSDDSSE